MKKSIIGLLILTIAIQTLVAANIRPVVEESSFNMNISGGTDSFTGSENQLITDHHLFDLQYNNGTLVNNLIYLLFDVEYTKQSVNSDLTLAAYDNDINIDLLATPLSVDVSSSFYADYTYYFNADTLPIFVGASTGTSGVSYDTAGSNNVTATPEIYVGIGRVYSINRVTRAKLLMDALNVEQTEEKVKAVATILNRSTKLINEYNFGSAKPASYDFIIDYYQEIADAMGIPERLKEVMAADNYKYIRNASYRNAYVSTQTGVDFKIFAYSTLEYKFDYPTPADNGFTYSDIMIGARSNACGYLIDNTLYGEADLRFYYSFDTTDTDYPYASAQARLVYFPPISYLLLEIAAEADYDINANAFGYNASAAIHALLDRDIALYAGGQYLGTSNGSYDMGVFAGANISLY